MNDRPLPKIKYIKTLINFYERCASLKSMNIEKH